jgi:hypothetical protein
VLSLVFVRFAFFDFLAGGRRADDAISRRFEHQPLLVSGIEERCQRDGRMHGWPLPAKVAGGHGSSHGPKKRPSPPAKVEYGV